jgi:hypothetical protein
MPKSAGAFMVIMAVFLTEVGAIYMPKQALSRQCVDLFVNMA